MVVRLRRDIRPSIKRGSVISLGSIVRLLRSNWQSHHVPIHAGSSGLRFFGNILNIIAWSLVFKNHLSSLAII